MFEITAGKRLLHRSRGLCQVMEIEGRYFIALFKSDRKAERYVLKTAHEYFRETDALTDKYHLGDCIPPDVHALLASFDKGSTSVSEQLVSRLDGLREFFAVDAVCRELEKLGIRMDFFLRVKHAKALRQIGKGVEAIEAATSAIKQASNQKELAIALTVKAAAQVDWGLLNDAERDCQAALGSQPGSAHAYGVLGRIYFERSDYRAADRYFEMSNPIGSSGSGKVWKNYRDRVEQLAAANRSGEIEQIRRHIQSHWPKVVAQHALAEISCIVQRYAGCGRARGNVDDSVSRNR